MKTSGKQLAALQDVLLSAFPNPDDLAEVVRFHLDEKLHEIAGGGNHRNVTFKLIEWAESQGRIDDLVRAAIARAPGNPALRAYLAAYPHAPAAAPPPGQDPPASQLPLDNLGLDLFLALAGLTAKPPEE